MNYVTATDKTQLYVKDWGSGPRLTKDLIDFLGR